MNQIPGRSVGIITTRCLLLTLLVYVGSPSVKVTAHATTLQPTPASQTIFAQGLNNPRGLKFGPDGNLYVAEGGVGGFNSTIGAVCPSELPGWTVHG